MDLGTPHLRFEERGPIAWCTVNNPTQRNALSIAMYRGLARAIRAVRDSTRLDALIVTGVDDVFIVGGDPTSHGSESETVGAADLPFGLLYDGQVPVVAAINGHCQASGVWLSLLADVAVASERAQFRLPELRLGVASPWTTTLLPAVVGAAVAKDLVLTSRSVAADEARAVGLISRVVPHNELHKQATRTAQELLEAAPLARASWKKDLHHKLGVVVESEVAASIATTEASEGFAAFAAHRPPVWSHRARHVMLDERNRT